MFEEAKKFRLQNSGPVLIVDDDDEFSFIARKSYLRSSLKNPILVLGSGAALLEHMRKVLDGTEEFPELILLDINMPGMNGHETLKALRAFDQFKRIPVIFMFSISENPKDKEISARNGANGYWVKPGKHAEYVRLFNSLAVAS